MQGWLFTESSPAERVMMFVAGIVLVYPGLLTDLIGFGTASLVFFIQIARKKRLCAA
ncbi:FxsA family protein [Bilophila wadsworthia]